MRAGETEVVARKTSRGLARAGFIGIGGTAAAALFGWLRAKGLAVTLGPARVGLYGQVWAFVIYVAGFASLGLGIGTTSYVASHRARNERAEIAAVTRMSLVLPAVASAVIALLTLALASLLSPLVLGEHLPWLIVLAALSIPFATMQLPLQHVLQGFEDVGGQNVVYVVYSAVFTVTVLVGAYVGGLYGAVIGLAIGNAVLAGLYLGRTGRLLALARAPLRGARRGAGSAGPLLRIGAASLAVTVVYGAADLAVRTTLLHTNGSRSAGYWFALLTVSVQFIASLAGAMSYFTAPLAARAVGEGKREETQRLLDDSLRLAIGVIMPAIVLLIAIRHGVVGILFSDAFDPIARWLPIQLTGDAVRTVGWVLGVALVPLGLTRAWLATGVGASIVFAGVGSLFAAHWGLGGAASAWLITWTASTIAVVVVLIRKGFWRPSRRTLAGLLVTAAAVAATTAFPGAIGVVVTALATAALGATLAGPGERTRILRAVAGLLRT